MPVAAVTLKLRRFRQRFGIRAERVKVQTHMPMHWYIYGGLGGVVVVALLVFGFIRWTGIGGISSAESNLQARVQELESEVSRLRTSAGTEENSLHMLGAAQRGLLEKLKGLERENASLKEEIAFYERIGVKGASNAGLRLERVRIDPDLSVQGRYRYRLLLANQAASSSRAFKGSLQFHLLFSRDGQAAEHTLPQGKDVSLPEYQLSVQNVESKEGFFDAPPGVVMSGVEVRVLQDGAIKARQMVRF